MDDELRNLHEAMVIKERLRVFADIQASYWEALTERGFDGNIAEQLMLDWSRHAYGMTMRSLPDPSSVEVTLDDLLGAPGADGPADGAQPAGPTSSNVGDPSSVPPGEPWLQLVEDVDLDDEDDARAA
jgi:hypothetical protein